MQEISSKGLEKTNNPKSGFRIEVDKVREGLSMLVYGVSSVRELTETLAYLRSGKSGVIINGSALSVAVYEGFAVEITGRIKTVEFI